MFNPLENINPKSRLAKFHNLFLKNVTVSLMKSEKSNTMLLTLLPSNEYDRKALNAFMEMALTHGLDIMAINTENHTQRVLSLREKANLDYDIK